MVSRPKGDLQWDRTRARFAPGFTLIELLIVIAIILILIAIALPNFLEAQIRARVTKARGELRTLATALISYSLDWKIYPGRSAPDYANPARNRSQLGLTWLTSPIAYLTSLPDDPFPLGIDIETDLEAPGPFTYNMHGVDQAPGDTSLLHPHGEGLMRMYYLVTAGPDAPTLEVPPTGCPACPIGGPTCAPIHSYAPTNGSKSRGDLFLFGGESVWMGIVPIRINCIGYRDQLSLWKSNPSNGVMIDGTPYLSRFPPQTL